jgi:hypothetical protein
MSLNIDGIKNIWDGLLKSNLVISNAFENIKNVFNEIILFVYEIYFFIVFLLFIVISIGMFIALPIYLVKWVAKNRKIVNNILSFEFKA